MCYVCSCFSWMLDFIQRVITFVLACWMFYAIFIGLLVAAVAGVAYGYNYCMAEFLTFTRSDVTVYMRRGQFYDQPDVRPKGFRRSGDEEDAFSGAGNSEVHADYEEKKPPVSNAKTLQDTWTGARDTRHYADKLINFGHPQIPEKDFRAEGVQVDMTTDETIIKEVTPSPFEYYKLTSPPTRKQKIISVTPNVLMSTAVWQRGSSKIVMRNFHMSPANEPGVEDFESDYPGFRVLGSKERERMEGLDLHRSRFQHNMRPSIAQDMKIIPEDVTRSTHQDLPYRDWGPVSSPSPHDYRDEVEEDNVVYKPG